MLTTNPLRTSAQTKRCSQAPEKMARKHHDCMRFVHVALIALACVPSVKAQDNSDDNEAGAAPPSIVETMAAPPAAPGAPAMATFEGMVSYYGREFAGRRTANGERFDPAILSMAHPTLPFGTWVRVTNLINNLSVVVRVNDRGPYIRGRIADLSAGAAHALDMLRAGVVQARLEVMEMLDKMK